MRKVKVHSEIVGSTRQFTRFLSTYERKDIANEVMLDQVKTQVRFNFGERSTIVHNFNSLMTGDYPPYYAAGWFVSEESGLHGTDLVVIAHGKDMKSAQDEVINAVQKLDWDSLASKY